MKILYNYNDYIKSINEGLIKTHNIDNSISILQMNLNSFKQEFKIIKNSESVFELELINDISLDLIDNILIIVNNTGYFPSFVKLVTINNIQGQYKFDQKRLNNDIEKKKIVNLIIRFESKFDERIDNNFEYLYHVCNKVNLPKILKIGLYPKAKNKIGKHPERVYLLKNVKDCYNLIKRFKFEDLKNIKETQEYVILKIKIDNNIKLYNDPNYNNIGCYTYENINKNDITVIENEQ